MMSVLNNPAVRSTLKDGSILAAVATVATYGNRLISCLPKVDFKESALATLTLFPASIAARQACAYMSLKKQAATEESAKSGSGEATLKEAAKARNIAAVAGFLAVCVIGTQIGAVKKRLPECLNVGLSRDVFKVMGAGAASIATVEGIIRLVGWFKSPSESPQPPEQKNTPGGTGGASSSSSGASANNQALQEAEARAAAAEARATAAENAKAAAEQEKTDAEVSLAAANEEVKSLKEQIDQREQEASRSINGLEAEKTKLQEQVAELQRENEELKAAQKSGAGASSSSETAEQPENAQTTGEKPAVGDDK